MEYDWIAARLAEMFPNMHSDVAVERELFACVLQQTNREVGKAVELLTAMQRPARAPALAEGHAAEGGRWLAQASSDDRYDPWDPSVAPSTVVATKYVPWYWKKFWYSQGQGRYDVGMKEAERVLFTDDDSYVRLGEEQGMVELRRTMSILFEPVTNTRRSNKEAKAVKKRSKKWIYV